MFYTFSKQEAEKKKGLKPKGHKKINLYKLKLIIFDSDNRLFFKISVSLS